MTKMTSDHRGHGLRALLTVAIMVASNGAYAQADSRLEPPAGASSPVEGNPGSTQADATPPADTYPDVIPVLPTPSEPSQPESAPRVGRQIEEIIVTAQKRESTIEDAPLSLSALSGDDMGFRAVSGAADLQFQVPGLNVSEGTNATMISIRGVGSSVDSGQTEPSVAVHIDGVYQPRPTTGVLGLNDLERVEVLKGPQGTLYGRNSTGGVVNYILRKPTDTFEASLRTGVASFGGYSGVGIISGPLLEDRLNGRIMVEWDTSDGWVKDHVSGELSDDRKGYGGRVALQWLATDALTADLSLLYRSDEGGAMAPRDVCLAPPDPDVERSSLVVPPTDPEDCLQGKPHERKITRLPTGERETINAALTVLWNLDSFNLKSITGYQDHRYFNSWDYDSLARDIIWVQGNDQGASSLSEELNISGTAGDLQWLIGAFYFDSHFDPRVHVILPPVAAVGLDVRLQGNNTTESYAAFTDLTYRLTDSWRIGVGARVLRDEKRDYHTNQYGLLAVPVPFPGSIPTVFEECENLAVIQSFDKFTPKFTTQWDAFDNLTLYANYSVGYQAGGSNYSSCGDTYEPEENNAAEIGFKANWFGRRLVTNGSVFHSDYTNLQVMKVIGFASQVINVPKATIQGAELDIEALVTDQLLVNLGLSLLDAHYKEFCDQDPVVADNQEPHDCPTGEQLRDLSGVQLTRSPNYTINLGAEYSWELPFELTKKLRMRAEWFKADDQLFRPFGSPHDGQKSYSIVNAYVSLTSSNERLELRIAGKNLGDTEYFLNKVGNSLGERYGTAGQPRSIGAELLFRL
jgi:iron complex outermembrane receptor protein